MGVECRSVARKGPGMMVAATVAVLTAFGCSAEQAAPVAPPSAGSQAMLPEAVAGLLDEIDFSGTVLVAEGGEVLVHEAVNAGSGERLEALQADSRFPVASITKSFTAALVLKLVDEGKLGLDQTLAELLPEYDAGYADQVTLRQLLQNRSGIPHYVDIPGWFDNETKRAFTDETFLEAAQGLSLKFPPGSDYLYSNVNYYLLGLIVDRHAGVPYEDYLQMQILTPLGMSETGQIYRSTTRLAENYLRQDDGTYQVLPIVNPALFRGTASMVSTADDLYLWGQAVLDGSVYSQAAAREAFSEDTPMAWDLGQLPIGQEETTDVLYYNGRLIGYLSLILLMPEHDGVIVVLNNNTAGYDNMLAIGATLAATYFDAGT